MFLSLICIDMATTAINNYMDYVKAVKREGYGFEEHNAIVRDRVEVEHVKMTIIALLGLGLIFGLVLVWLTDWIVLAIGVASACIGILYSYGPVPISRTPLGEIASGVFMGFLIPLLAFYIQYHSGALIAIHWRVDLVTIAFDYRLLLAVLFVSVPLAIGIGNIMLANNICDVEDDIANRRYTLVAYIGRDHALVLFQVLVAAAYFVLIASVALGLLPIFSILAIATVFVVYPLTRKFCSNPVKSQTFANAVKSFVLMAFSMVLSVLIGIGYEFWV
jgi:1,4-dihydroxy-2-naphthoate octaprenyltransferase